MKRKIAKGLMLAGALLAWGAAGDSDTGRLTFEGAVIKVVAAIVLFAVGYILYIKAKSSEQNSEDFTKHISLNSKQTTTSVYDKYFTTQPTECQPYFELKIVRNEVTEC